MNKLVIAACLSALAAWSANAAEVSVTIAPGETKTLDEALAAEEKSLGNSDTLVKYGEGRLTLGEMPDFTGDIHICEGVVNATVSTSLGNAEVTGTTTVDDGATLEIGTTTTASKTLSFKNKTIVIAGTGVNGNGAIQSLCRSGQQDSCYPIGDTLRLSGDALVKVGGSRHDFGNYLDLGGHTLTLDGNFSFQFVTCQNGGHIVNQNGSNMFPRGNSGGDENNTYTIKEGGYIYFCWSPLKDWVWTMVMDGGYISLTAGGSDDYWNGPVWLKGPGMTKFISSAAGVNIRFPKRIYGDGGINWNGSVGTLRLLAENTFKGGISFGGGILKLEHGNAIPTGDDCGGMVLTNTSLQFASGIVATLPATEFVGTGYVGRCNGKWTGPVVKKGAGELFYESCIGGELLDVREGSVRFSRSSLAGLNHGSKNYADKDAVKAAYATGVCFTNSFEKRLGDFEKNNWSQMYLTTYDGYIWNSTGSDVIWTWHACIDDAVEVYIDGEKVIDQSGWTSIVTKDITLTPGYHSFVTRAWNGDGGSGASNANGKWRNGDGSDCNTKGVAVDRLARGEALVADNYEPLVDPGDGSLFTISCDLAQFDKIRCAPGAQIDFDHVPYVCPELEGFPIFVNADQITVEKWTLDGKMVAAGNAASFDGKLVFAPDAQLIVSDEAGSWRLSGDLSDGAVVCTAEGGIEGMPSLSCSKNAAFLEKSSDGKSLILHAKVGMVLLLK